jgi:hypothetical protein
MANRVATQNVGHNMHNSSFMSPSSHRRNTHAPIGGTNVKRAYQTREEDNKVSGCRGDNTRHDLARVRRTLRTASALSLVESPC